MLQNLHIIAVSAHVHDKLPHLQVETAYKLPSNYLQTATKRKEVLRKLGGSFEKTGSFEEISLKFPFAAAKICLRQQIFVY